MLESKQKHCCSPVYVLLHDGRPCGHFKFRLIWSSSIDVYLFEQQHLVVQKFSWFSSYSYEIVDRVSGEQHARMKRASRGALKWNLSLTIGECSMVRVGENRDYRMVVKQDEQDVAKAGPTAFGWCVEPVAELSITDQLMIGLAFRMIAAQLSDTNF